MDIENEILDSDYINKTKDIKYKLYPIVIWMFLFIIGYVFKIMHWPTANIMIILSSAAFLSYSLNGILWKEYRKLFYKILCIFGFIWLFYILYGYFYRNGSSYNLQGLLFYAGAFALTFFTSFIISYFKIKRHRAFK